jgi:hypothetical protein
VPTLQEKIEERNKKLFIKPSNIEFDPRHKMKGKGGSAKRHHIRKQVIEEARRANLKSDIGKILFSSVQLQYRGLYFGPKSILIPFPSEKKEDNFSPLWGHMFFDSHHSLFALILPYFATILPFNFPLTDFLSPFFLFLLYFPPFSLRFFLFFPPNDIG